MHLLAIIQAADNPGMSHIQIAAIVIAVVAVVGLIISLVQRGANYKGYEEYASEIDRIAKTMKAEIFRDGEDLGVTGNHKKYPVQLRFSYSETTPGLVIRMQCPVSFTFSVVPKGERATEGRVLVRTGDDMFDARFASRTDHPTQAKMLVSSKSMRTNLEKLCCSSKTFVTLTTGAIEVSELVIPGPYTARHVLDHLDSMAVVARGCEDIPGAEKVKIAPYEREKSSPVAKIAIAAGVVVAMIAIFVMSPTTSANLREVAGTPPPAGVAAIDMQYLGDVTGYHAANADDYDPTVAAWMRGSGVNADGRLEARFDQPGDLPDVAYWLVNPNTKISRLVILRNGQNIYDVKYTDLVGAVRVPASSLQNMDWEYKPAEEPKADGIMVFRRAKSNPDKLIADVIFPASARIISAKPKDYQTVSLQ
jgi:hypothetical protein